MNPEKVISLSPVDLAIITIYFLAVLAIGFYLKRFAKSGEDFFLAGREMTAWVAGLAFLSANLGSLKRSPRPIPFARAGHLSGVSTMRNQLSSELLYTLNVALGGCNRSCCG